MGDALIASVPLSCVAQCERLEKALREVAPQWHWYPGIGQLLLRCLNSGIHAVAMCWRKGADILSTPLRASRPGKTGRRKLSALNVGPGRTPIPAAPWQKRFIIPSATNEPGPFVLFRSADGGDRRLSGRLVATYPAWR